MREFVADLLRDARHRVEPLALESVRGESGSLYETEAAAASGLKDWRVSFPGQLRVEKCSSAAQSQEDCRNAGLQLAAQRVRGEIERLLRLPPYPSRRELRVKGIELSDKDLLEVRMAALRARRTWLGMLEELLLEPRLEDALIAQMGEQRFADAKRELDRRFADLPLEPEQSDARPLRSGKPALNGMRAEQAKGERS